MHNGSFPHSCVWSILIKSELEESEPPRKQKDFHLAAQWRGPSSAHDRKPMASEAKFPIMRILFIFLQIDSILKERLWKKEKDANKKGSWVGWGGVGGLGQHYCMCFALIVALVVFIYWWPSGLRDEAASDPEGSEKRHDSGTISTPAETRSRQR